MAYFKKMEPGWEICENWKDFILCGNEEIYDAMETDTEDLSGSDPHLREFKLKARYLLFCISAKELPTKGNLSKLIKDAMEEAGSVENIKLLFPYTKTAWNSR